MYFTSDKNYICIKRKLHIINNLSIKVLINMNIMIFEKMNINIKHEIIIINVCENMIILILIKIKDQAIHASIFNKKRMIVLTHITMSINIVNINAKLNLSCNKDFMFKSKTLNKLSIYTHIININIINIFV